MADSDLTRQARDVLAGRGWAPSMASALTALVSGYPIAAAFTWRALERRELIRWDTTADGGPCYVITDLGREAARLLADLADGPPANTEMTRLAKRHARSMRSTHVEADAELAKYRAALHFAVERGGSPWRRATACHSWLKRKDLVRLVKSPGMASTATERAVPTDLGRAVDAILADVARLSTEESGRG